MIEHETLLVTLVKLVGRRPGSTCVGCCMSCVRGPSRTCNEQFKGIFDAHSQVPTKGWGNTRRFALGAALPPDTVVVLGPTEY